MPFIHETANERLDDILYFLNSYPSSSFTLSEITDEIAPTNELVNDDIIYVDIMCRYLEKQEMIQENGKGYAIEFLGQKLIESRGFLAKENAEVAAYERDMAQLRRLEDVDNQSLQNQKELNDLTAKLIVAGWAAAIATGAYFLWTVLTYMLDHHWWLVDWLE